MKLRKCLNTSKHKNNKIIYSFNDVCPVCSIKTQDAHYKFIKIKSIKNAQNNFA